jgi:hypothetical protein
MKNLQKSGKYRMNQKADASCNSFPWTIKDKALTDDQSKTASSFMRNAVNEFGCFDSAMQKVVASVKDGMKGEGAIDSTGQRTKSSLTCLCPYGMTYNPDSTNQELNKVIGENCVDVKAPNCKKSIMGQCVDEPPQTVIPKSLKQVYLTWFWWPNLDEKHLLMYIDMQIKTCHAMAKGTKGPNGKIKALPVNVNGLCFPVTAWPDQNNNLSFLFQRMTPGPSPSPSYGNAHNRQILADWMYKHMFTNSLLTMDGHTVNPGLLLYISFKDGPWTGFYSSDYNSQINPLTGKVFGKYEDWDKTPGTGSQWVWGAFFHFMKNYICKGGRQLPANFWLHLDKEGSQSNDDGFSQQMYTDATKYFIGPLIEKYQPGQPILYLATGVDGGAQNLGPNKFVENFTTASDPTCSTSGLSGTWCNNKAQSVGVPEYYWGVGNQMPCDGSEGSYGYARTSCTSLSSHRRLSGYPKQYIDLITGGEGGDSGSDCKGNGWLGMGSWKPAIANAQKDNEHVWPSFSIENLSMCDLNDPDCYNQWTKEKQKGAGPGTAGLPYTGNWGENTTICNSMLWGAQLDGGTTQDLKQGMKSCGVFDGFSHWTWPSFANFLHYFSNKYQIPNLIVYEASFIPYHWLKSLGITEDSEWPWKGQPQESALLPPPEIPTREKNTCGFYNQAPAGKPMSCKAVQGGEKGDKYCDAACSIPCENGKNRTTGVHCGVGPGSCGTGSAWKPGPTPTPGPPPTPGPSGSGDSSSSLTIIIISIIAAVVLLAIIGFFLFRKNGRKKGKYIELKKMK